MREQSDLFHYQRAIVEQALARPKVSVFVPVGYGKTAAVLTALEARNEWPALVVAPKRVAKHVWPAEAAEWAHLKNLTVTHLGTGEQRRKRLKFDSHIETIGYEALVGSRDGVEHPFTGLTEEVRLEKRYRTIVFDELSKVKSPDTRRFRRLRAHAAGIPYRIGLAGVAVGNHLLDLWGEMFMVAGEGPLGPTYSGFRERYFEAKDYYQRNWELKNAGLEMEIHRRVAPWAYSLPAQYASEVKIPPVQVNHFEVPYPPRTAALAKELEKELWVALDSGVELEALSASTLAMKLRQFASGAVYTDPDTDAWEHLHDEKLDALEEILDEMQGEPLVVVYGYRHEVDRIRKRFGKRAVEVKESGAIERWNRREIEILMLHPLSAGHGLNLQHGGSTLFWFTPTWSHDEWVQVCGRLARTGQKAPFVMAHVPICGPVDARVLGAVAGKGEVDRRLMNFLVAA